MGEIYFACCKCSKDVGDINVNQYKGAFYCNEHIKEIPTDEILESRIHRWELITTREERFN